METVLLYVYYAQILYLF